MSDYSLFPWDTLTRDEIAKLMIHSKEIGDDDFVKACVEQLKRRPTPRAADGAYWCGKCRNWSKNNRAGNCVLCNTPRR